MFYLRNWVSMEPKKTKTLPRSPPSHKATYWQACGSVCQTFSTRSTLYRAQKAFRLGNAMDGSVPSRPCLLYEICIYNTHNIRSLLIYKCTKHKWYGVNSVQNLYSLLLGQSRASSSPSESYRACDRKYRTRAPTTTDPPPTPTPMCFNRFYIKLLSS